MRQALAVQSSFENCLIWEMAADSGALPGAMLLEWWSAFFTMIWLTRIRSVRQLFQMSATQRVG